MLIRPRMAEELGPSLLWKGSYRVNASGQGVPARCAVQPWLDRRPPPPCIHPRTQPSGEPRAAALLEAPQSVGTGRRAWRSRVQAPVESSLWSRSPLWGSPRLSESWEAVWGPGRSVYPGGCWCPFQKPRPWGWGYRYRRSWQGWWRVTCWNEGDGD